MLKNQTLTSIIFSDLSFDKQYPKSNVFPSNERLKDGSTPTPLSTIFKLDLLVLSSRVS